MATRSITRDRDKFQACKIKRQPQERVWKKNGDIYDGKHWNGITTTYDDQITFNLAKTMIDTIRDSVYFRNPQFVWEAANKEFDVISDVLNQIFPQILKNIMYKHMTKLCVFDALRYGVGYKLNGYTLDGDLTNDAIRPDEVHSIWIPHDSVYLDKDAYGMWDSNYLFMEVDRGYDEVKNHPAYRIPKSFKESYTVGDVNYRDENDPKRCKLIHMFDRGDGKHRIFCDENGSQAYIYDEDWPLGPDCNFFPINSLRINENGLYPPGVIESIVPLNEEFNKMESMKVTHAKRFNRKYHVKGAELEQKAREALEAGYDGAIITTEEDVSITPLADADLTQAVYATANDCWTFMKMILRVSDYRMGQRPTGEMTATEAQMVEGGSNLGNDYTRDVIADFCERDGVCLLALMRENYDTEKYFRLTNGQSVPFSRELLEGADFNLNVDCEGSAPPERVQERQEALSLMELLGESPFINPLKPIEQVLKTFRSVTNPKEWMNTPAVMNVIAQSMSNGGPDANMSAIKSYLESGQTSTILPATKYTQVT